MALNIQLILDALVPDNIKEIPLYKDLLDVFADRLSESKISIDIGKVFSDPSNEIRDVLLQTYLADIYRVFNEARENTVINGVTDTYNTILGTEYINLDFLSKLPLMLSSENYITSKAFAQKKGTITGIEYIYNMVSQAQGLPLNTLAITNTSEPFNFDISGEVRHEVYDQIVRKLSHPLGFTYFYKMLLKLIFDEIFGIKFLYTVSYISVKCLYGSERIFNPEYVIDIWNFEDPIRGMVERFIFRDGTYLEQYTNPSITVTLYNPDDTINTSFTGHCSIFSIYTTKIISTVEESLVFYVNNNFSEEFFNYAECKIIGDTIYEDKDQIGEFFICKSNCKIIGNNEKISEDQIGEFYICSSNTNKKTAKEEYSVEIGIDFRKDWQYIKRFTEPLDINNQPVSPPHWTETYKKVYYRPYSEISEGNIGDVLLGSKNNIATFNPILLDSEEVFDRYEKISEQAGINRFFIGGLSSSIIDYNHLYMHIHAGDGSVPIISRSLIVGHFIIGGFHKLTENLPIFPDRVTRLENNYSTELYDIQEFSTEMFDFERSHVFMETYENFSESLSIISNAMIIESFYDRTDRIAKINDINLLIGNFIISGISSRNITDEFLIEEIAA